MKPIFRTGYSDFMLFITFLMLWISIQFGQVIQDVIAYVLVVSIGILHGANDLFILAKDEQNKHRLRKHIVYYLLIIIGCIFLYILHSLTAILLFVLLSAYHFGEEHWSEKLSTAPIFSSFYFTVYGLLLFVLLFYENLLEVNLIFFELTGNEFDPFVLKVAIISNAIIFLGLSTYIIVTNKHNKINFFKELFYLVLLFLVFKTATLIMSFAIYFIFWHSIPSIIHQSRFLSGDFTKNTAIFYVKKAMIFWLISVAGLIGIYLLIPDLEIFGSVIFAILFAVTAPHTWVMFRMKTSE